MAEETIVLSDASPLIGLAAAGCFEVLRELFDTVHITESVRKEVTARKHLPGAAETRVLALSAFPQFLALNPNRSFGCRSALSRPFDLASKGGAQRCN